MNEPLLVSKREAAALIGVSVRTLENLIGNKQLPTRRIGRRCLIERSALERFARHDHRTRPGQDGGGADSQTETGSAR